MTPVTRYGATVDCQIFRRARQSAPSLIVFDELDSFASARGTYTGSGVEHSMVNQLLTEMDGFHREEMVFVVGTTNANTMLVPGFVATFTTTFKRVGEHLMPCHEYCGTGHEAMWARVQVIPARDFLARAGANDITLHAVHLYQGG